MRDSDNLVVLFYAIRNTETGKYLVKNKNYRNDRTSEFYDGHLSSAYLFDDLITADDILKEYGNSYEIRKMRLYDEGRVNLWR